jgi:anti-sigma B factor antagonist
MTYFDIEEQHQGEWTVLRLTGELDVGSAPVLRHRLAQLSADNQPVRLDLSRLGFIDSSGMHLLIAAVTEARTEQRRLEVLHSLGPNVEQSLRLAKLERILAGPHLN